MEVDFQSRINEFLVKKRISQAELCRRTGIATSAMSKYSTGQSKPTLETAMEIAQALDISLDELVGWKPHTLTEQEKILLEKFRELDDDERREIVNYTEYKHDKKFLREKSSKEAG